MYFLWYRRYITKFPGNSCLSRCLSSELWPSPTSLCPASLLIQQGGGKFESECDNLVVRSWKPVWSVMISNLYNSSYFVTWPSRVQEAGTGEHSWAMVALWCRWGAVAKEQCVSLQRWPRRPGSGPMLLLSARLLSQLSPLSCYPRFRVTTCYCWILTPSLPACHTARLSQ